MTSSGRYAGLTTIGMKCVFIAFLVAFYLPLSSKATNNIFYIGIALPAALWLLQRPVALKSLLRSFAWFFLLLFAMTLVFAVKDMMLMKRTLYLLLLFSACLLMERSPGAARQIFAIFALISMCLFLYSLGHWLWQYYTLEQWGRQQLWGATTNPVHAALLIMSALVFLWLFYIERLLERRSVWLLVAGFSLLVTVGLLCGAVFQARSAMLGFGLFVAVYLLQRRLIFPGFLVMFCVLGVLYWLGVTDALLERGLSYRLAIWQDAARRVIDDCGLWQGCSGDYRFLGRFYHAHSAYISLFYSFGLIGVSVFALFALVFFWRASRAGSDWMLVALVGWGGVVTSSSGVFTSPAPLWVYFWLPTFLAVLEAQRGQVDEYYAVREMHAEKVSEI